MISIICFILLFVVGFTYFALNIIQIRKNILIGKSLDLKDKPRERFKNMLLVAFGQQKMFSRPIPAILHLFIYVAFIITQIELIEIIIDGVTNNHRSLFYSLGGFYTFMISFIEILSVLALFATIVFLSRRNVLKLTRFHKPEMKGFPFKDGNIILLMEFVLVCCIFTMNGADETMSLLKGNGSYGFAISSLIGPNIFGGIKSVETLHILEKIGWWGHIIMVFVFLNYLPFSKHLHILLAFPNTYFANLNSKGKFSNMESVTAEVKLMLDPNADPYSTNYNDDSVEPQRFGAKDVNDLTWKNLLDSYTCTECGRCTSSCPANITGKKLSPRKIMMDVRDRVTELGKYKNKNGVDAFDGKSLLRDYISEEEIWACTSCNACVQECPVNIDPLSVIIDLRRYLVMEESAVPTELAGMLTNIENNGAPWQFSPSDRLKWKDE